MIITNISFENAVKTVEYYITPYKKGKLKGKTPLETCENGFTSYVNSVKVLEQYVRIGEYTTPSKHAQAKDLLNKIKEEKW
ncbi:putative coil containing protein II [Vibrio phage VPMCC14]|nr:putative coil containing protein II [Vibrio phage VPMCC14]